MSGSHSAKCNFHFGSVTCQNLNILDKSSVTQATNIITGVQLSSPIGLIKTASDTMVTGASASFTIAHPSINNNSVIFACIGSYIGNAIPHVRVSSFSAGSSTLTISNISTVNSMSGTSLSIAYQII